VASADAAPLAADVRRQARRGALRGELTAGAASLALTSASSLFIESAVR